MRAPRPGAGLAWALVAGLALGCLALAPGRWDLLAAPALERRAAIGLAVNAALALAAYAGRGVDRSGAVAGIALGTWIWACLDWRGFLLLFAFFVLGTVATRVGFAAKARQGLAQEGGGRRSARNALAKTTVPALCALAAVATGEPTLFLFAFAGAFAAAAADTCSSEIGQVYGRRTFLVTTLRTVPRGTQGAVSLEGTAAGVGAALAIAALGAGVGLLPGSGVGWVVAAALFATTLESVLGATLEQRGLLDNEAVNLLASLAGALAAAGLGWLAGARAPTPF